MRGQTFCHCSRTMLSRPATARAQVPNAIASVANSSRPATKSRARTTASNVRSQSWGVATEGAMPGIMHREYGMLLVMPPSRRPLRVLHTADVHLESDGYGDAHQQAAHTERGRRIFQRIVDRALTDKVDLLLIAGDLFDHIRVIRRLDGEIIDLPELDAVVWGRAMEEHEPGFQPLAHIPGRDARRWCLAMGHGFFYRDRQRPDRSSPIC